MIPHELLDALDGWEVELRQAAGRVRINASRSGRRVVVVERDLERAAAATIAAARGACPSPTIGSALR